MIDNINTLKNDRINSTSSVYPILSLKSGYIPLFTLKNYKFPIFSQNFLTHYSLKQDTGNYESKVRLNLHKSNYSVIGRRIWQHLCQNISWERVVTKEYKSNVVAYINQVKQEFLDYINSSINSPIRLCISNSGLFNEDEKFNLFKNSDLLFITTKSYHLVGSGLIGYQENGYNISGTIMFKEEYLPYIKLCLILDKEINYSIFEFWVDSKLEDTDYSNSSIRSLYRKYIKDYITSKNIPIIEKEDLTKQLIFNIEEPIFTSPKSKLDWLESSKNEFLNHLRGDNKLEVKEFKYKEKVKEIEKASVSDKEFVLTE